MGKVARAGVAATLITGLAIVGIVALGGQGDERSVSADPLVERGQQVVEACTVCHAVGRRDAPRVGPPLWNIVDAPKARTEGFGYSDALATAGGTWDAASLDAFLRDPQGYLPGTTMVFGGIADSDDRESAIAYLRSRASK